MWIKCILVKKDNSDNKDKQNANGSIYKNAQV